VRRRANRPTLDTLFIFGAGASYDASEARDRLSVHTTPLDRQFCERIKSEASSTSCPAWVRETALLILQSWRDTKPFENCGLEEAVLLQVAHLNFLNAIQPRRLPTIRSPAGFALKSEWDFVYHLAHIVAFILRHCREKPSSPFRRIARDFFHGRQLAGVTNRAITFNYDLLFDHHLLNRFAARDVYFEGIGRYGGAGDSNPLLLKVHGSANWFIFEEEYDKAFSTEYISKGWRREAGWNLP